MKLYPIHGGYFKLDGGAMFGVVPKSIWQKSNPSDKNNMIDMATRCLLVEDGDRLILIDNGLGNKQSEKFFSYYFLFGDASLEKSLAEYGFGFDDITDVFLTHLHFDHCGGSIRRKAGSDGFEPVFKNATYWSSSKHWQWAMEPNVREKVSFLKENIMPIKESGQLKFVDKEFSADADGYYELFQNFSVGTANGHTESLMLPHINYKGQILVYVTDLIPTHGHIPVPYIMSYDTRPLIALEEKARFLQKATDHNYILFFEHDAYHDCATVEHTDKGIRLKAAHSFIEIFG